MTAVGRNDPCPCGSGKKYKRCCLPGEQGRGAGERPPTAFDVMGRVSAWVATQPEWAERRDAVIDEHVGPVLGASDLSFEELLEEVGEEPVAAVLACALEDLCTRRYGPGGRDNVVDAYLARRGWRESPEERRYLVSLRDSVSSVYEVLDSKPGQGLLLRDLARPGETVEVHERRASRQLVRWDRVACRVVSVSGRNVLAGGVLLLSREVAEALLTNLTAAAQRIAKEMRRLSRSPDKSRLDEAQVEGMAAELALRGSAFAFSNLWLGGALWAAVAPPPEIRNTDGERIVFTTARFHLAAGRLDEVVRRLDACADLERSEEGLAWMWIRRAGGGRRRAKRTPAPRDTDFAVDFGSTVLGTLRVEGEELILEVNSMERAERGKKLVGSLLGDLCEPGPTEMEDLEAALAEGPGGRGPRRQRPRRKRADARRPRRRPTDLPPEKEAALLQQLKDRHYREWLDEPVPALGGKTPRRAVRTRSGRGAVLELLKEIENLELRQARRAGRQPYDSTWLWRELDLEAERPPER